MLRVWVHGCDPGRVSDSSRLATMPNSLYALRLYFSGMRILSFLFLSLSRFFCLCINSALIGAW